MAKKNEIIIVDLKVNVDDITTKMGTAREEVIRLQTANKELKKSIDEALANKNDAQVANLTKQLSSNEAQVKTLNTEIRQYQSTIQKTSQLNKASEGSYEQLLRQYELASVALKTLEGQQTRNADGTVVLSKEYEESAAKVKQLKDGVDSFNKGIGDGRSSVGLYAQGIKEAFADTGLFSEQIKLFGPLFNVAKGGADLFKNGIKGVGVAMTSTGIPLFAQALQLLAGLFGKNEAASEKFEQVMAAIGAIFNTIIGTVINLGKQIFGAISEPRKIWEAFGNYINGTFIQYFKSLGNVIAGIFTLDFDRVKEGFKGAGEAVLNVYKPAVTLAKGYKDMAVTAFEAAKAAVELTKRTQDLEDRERAFQNEATATKLKIDELIKSARERAGSEEERIRLLDEAAALEKKLLDEEVSIAKERLDIITAQNELLKTQGLLKDDDDQKRVDAANKLLELQGQSAIKQQEIENRKTLLINELNKKEIQNRIDTLNAKLAIEEASGRSSIALQKQIADEERKILLEDAKDNKLKQEQIELDYQAKLISINKKAAADRKAIREQTENIELSFIRDQNTRELAQIALEFQRKVDLLKGNFTEEAALREALEIEMQNKIRAVQERIEDEARAKKIQRIEENSDIELKAIEADFQRQEQALQVAASKRLIKEDELAEQLLQLKFQRAQRELDAVKEIEAQKILALETSFLKENALNQQKYDQGIISQEEFYKTQTDIAVKYSELALAQQKASNEAVLTATAEVTAARTEIIINGNQQIFENEQALANERARLQSEVSKAITASFATVNEVLAKDEASKKKNADLLKTLAVAQVLINLYTEVSGYWAGVGKDAAIYGNLYTEAVSVGIASLNSTLAGIRAGLALSNINKAFATGGHTGKGINFIDETGEPVAGIVHADEWIAPKWMVKNPIVSPVIHSLEEMRKTGKAVPFADGGFSSSVVSNIITTQTQNFMSAEEILKKVQIVAVAAEVTEKQIQTTIVEQTANV